MAVALDAYEHFKISSEGSSAAEYFFCSMVIGYGRPFTENHGIGNIKCEYPQYPDFPEKEMNDRHGRMIDLRNKFLAHSCAEGTKVIIIPPGALNPSTKSISDRFDHCVGKRTFLNPLFAEWLSKVVYEFKGRLDVDTRKHLEMEFGEKGFTEAFEVETPWEDFKWT